MDKLWCIHIMATKRNVLWIYSTTWVTLERIILNKKLNKKATYYTISFICHSRKGKSTGIVTSSVVTVGWG